ncbi:hypothetical protein C5167_002496 [Papaver somniferum]|uniref:Uncharacterized protein n=1 Tax=Papaver somniferum TaxID=3469 RepID=A0A4Y7L211_PAPSO|nr:hypothetical protein C5167_002496 [Papaver somniferum]
MGTKNVKVFIWLALTIAVLTSSEVSAVKDLAEKTELDKTEKNGVKDPKYGVSLIHCGSKGCCDFGERTTTPGFADNPKP